MSEAPLYWLQESCAASDPYRKLHARSVACTPPEKHTPQFNFNTRETPIHGRAFPETTLHGCVPPTFSVSALLRRAPPLSSRLRLGSHAFIVPAPQALGRRWQQQRCPPQRARHQPPHQQPRRQPFRPSPWHHRPFRSTLRTLLSRRHTRGRACGS